MTPPISIAIINYNGAKFLEKCLNSLLNQSYLNTKITVIDNVSTDNSLEILHQKFGQESRIEVIPNSINTGYVGGANQAIKLAIAAPATYLMILNPDIVFDPDYLEQAVAIMEKDPTIASFAGKIRRYDFDNNKKTNFIDTVGLHCFRNRRIVDYGQGQEDTGQFDQPQEVFGVSGACPLYRVSALQDIAIPSQKGSEIFDTDFFMYKEDVDVSWRLLLYGWKNYYAPSAIAYHGRGTGILQEFSHQEVYKNRRHASQLAKYHAYKNQRLMQIKSEFLSNIIQDFFPIIWKEILITGYIILREPRLLKAVFHLLRQTPSALRKRQFIKKNRKITASEMKKWFN